MKLRIKEEVFLSVHMFIPQVKKDTIREGYILSHSMGPEDKNPDWYNIGSVFGTLDEAKRYCNDVVEVPSERKVIIHELPEK
jgi:hypothetical protein